jgi:malate/lactate dehydrogenase
VPVILGREGVKQILEWELAPDEQEGLKRAADILKAAAQSIEDTLGQGRR